MKAGDVQILLGLLDAAVKARASSAYGHFSECRCDMCIAVATMQYELERQRQTCTACGRQRFEHVGVRHLFTRVANAKPQKGFVLP